MSFAVSDQMAAGDVVEERAMRRRRRWRYEFAPLPLGRDYSYLK